MKLDHHINEEAKVSVTFRIDIVQDDDIAEHYGEFGGKERAEYLNTNSKETDSKKRWP